MVPGSTFRYGSHFCRVTLKPRLSRRQPMEEAATPFPSEETTPPVTKIYFGAILIARVPTPGLSALHRSDVRIIIVGPRSPVKSISRLPQNGFFSGILEALAPKPFSIGPFVKLPDRFIRCDHAYIPVRLKAHVHSFQVPLRGKEPFK